VGKGDGSPIHLAGSLPNYIAGWAQDMTVFRRNLSEVQKISDQLIGIVDEAQPSAGEGGESTE